jgi:hypothetical protein
VVVSAETPESVLPSLHWFHTIPPSRPFLGIDGLNLLTRSLKGSSPAGLAFTACRSSFLIPSSRFGTTGATFHCSIAPWCQLCRPDVLKFGTTGATFHCSIAPWCQLCRPDVLKFGTTGATFGVLVPKIWCLVCVQLAPLVPLFRAELHS